MKYIITWVLVKMIPCPPTTPIPDEFGRLPNLSTVSTISCTMMKRDTLSKTFSDKSEALAMYERAKKEMKQIPVGLFGLSDHIEEIKLDSIKTK